MHIQRWQPPNSRHCIAGDLRRPDSANARFRPIGDVRTSALTASRALLSRERNLLALRLRIGYLFDSLE